MLHGLHVTRCAGCHPTCAAPVVVACAGQHVKHVLDHDSSEGLTARSRAVAGSLAAEDAMAKYGVSEEQAAELQACMPS